MKLGTFLDTLNLGELSNLYLGEEGLTGWSDINRRKVISYMNQGLKALSSKFTLIQRQVVLNTVTGINIYYLRREHAVSNPTVLADPSHKYLDDTNCDAFVGDVVKVIAIYKEDGTQMPINEKKRSNSLFTPSFDSIQIPTDLAVGSYAIIYQAVHPMLNNMGDASEEFNLPPELEEALVAFVAWKAFSFIGGQANDIKAAEHKTRYEEICAEVEMKDLNGSSEISENTKLDDNGWE